MKSKRAPANVVRSPSVSGMDSISASMWRASTVWKSWSLSPKYRYRSRLLAPARSAIRSMRAPASPYSENSSLAAASRSSLVALEFRGRGLPGPDIVVATLQD